VKRIVCYGGEWARRDLYSLAPFDWKTLHLLGQTWG
jgi:hypothetical protein